MMLKNSLCLFTRKTNHILIVQVRNKTVWSNVPQAPPDPIFGISEAFQKDKNPKKVNLGVGAYRSDEGKPFILRAVQKAEQKIVASKLNKEYLPMTGNAAFVKAAVKLAFGDAGRLAKGENVSAQCLSGTGALYIIAKFMKMFSSGNKVIYMPNPTWGNHKNIFTKAGMEFKSYTYYKPATLDLDFKGCLDSINKIPENSVILIHACAHNPTGVDPSKEQWKEISAAVKKRKLIPFFDMAYQGFASGNLDNDAFAPRLFLNDGHNLCLAQSFSKNMGLYGERVGTCTIFVPDAGERTKVLSQLKLVIRAVISNPPLHGSRIAETILNSPDLYKLWVEDVKIMANRVIAMRKRLQDQLKKAGSKKDWAHVTKQIGMFCFTGLNPVQVANITKKFSVYLTKDGRISVVGLTSKNCDYVAQAIHEVTK